MSDDKTTLGLTRENQDFIDELEPPFGSGLDAARFAMALAIREGATPDEISNTNTVWNRGTFDGDGDFRELVVALYPETNAPYRDIEVFINKGLDMIREHKEENKSLNLQELM